MVRRVELTVYARNDGAIRLYERCGFAIEGRHRATFCKGGEYIDSLTMAMLIE
jgi:putative acetyltransferase